MKRLFDIVCSIVGLLALVPLFVAVASLIKLDSAGPVFFVQKRVGRHLRLFNLYKFRTMVGGASDIGPAFTVGGDPRITRIGKILRKTKIDELPQLVNVLKGDMSLVGPRPEVAMYVEKYRDDYSEILRVRPGMTDIASMIYKDEEALLAGKENPEGYYLYVLLPDKIRLAKEYARKASFASDLKLILMTVVSLLFPVHPREKRQATIKKAGKT